MLDPKELGGGGGGGTANKLYKHTISCSSSTYGNVYLTIYNTSIEKIDSDAKIKTAIKSMGQVIATGYIRSGSIYNVYLARLASNDQVVASGYRHPTRTSSEVLFLCLLLPITLQLHYFKYQLNSATLF